MINEIVRILCSPGYWIGGLSVCINGSVASVGRWVTPSVIHFPAPIIGAFVVIRVQLSLPGALVIINLLIIYN